MCVHACVCAQLNTIATHYCNAEIAAVTVWLQYFEGLNFRSLRVNPLFGGIYFRCMHYDALSLASDRIASYPAVAVVSLLFSCYHTSTKV